MQVKSYEAERACGLTFQASDRHVDACETRAAREGIKRPCGSEQSKYRQRCQGVQVSDGLGGQHFFVSRVFILHRSMLVMSRVALMTLANVNLPQQLMFFSLMPESHATSCGVISPVDWDVRLDGGLQCKLRIARPSACTTDLSAPRSCTSSGPSARCSSRGHPASLRVGRVEVSATVSGGSS